MRMVVQRVSSGSVSVDGQLVGSIGRGLVLLVAVSPLDQEADVDWMARKIVHLRIFNDEQGRFNRSLLDVDGQVLVVSQFTLYADTARGKRPSFTGAAPPELARRLCDDLADPFQRLGASHVARGRFGAHMQMKLHNDGPVTLWLDSIQRC